MQINFEHSGSVQGGSAGIPFNGECHEPAEFDLQGRVRRKIGWNLAKMVGLV